MDIFSKIKKFEEADYFNQNLSNVLIDEDRDKFTIGHELIEESDYFNQNLSNVLIDEDRDKFTIGHELIDDSDYFNSNLSNVLIDEDRDKFTIDHELIDDSDYFNSNLSNVLLDTSSDIFADSFVLNDEESDFFNQNLNNALIEDVDLDSIVDTLSLVETAKQQSAVKYYKVEITKTPSTYTTATLSNGRFNGLRFKETTSTFETDAISENVVFTDSNNHDINAVVEYLNGRTESNNNSYNPSAFFVEDVSQSWGGTPWNTIEGDSNEDLIYRITFQTKIQRSDIESLTFNDINDDNVPVKFKLFVSNDLETWELLDSTTLSFNTDDNEYKYDSTNASISGPVDTWKIVLTGNPDSASTRNAFSLASFTGLEYVECLTAQNYSNTSETVVFTDGENNYNCIVSMNNRFQSIYTQQQDYYAPHNLFAPIDKRVCPSSGIFGSYTEHLIVTVQFTDPIAFSKIKSLNFRMGYEAPDGASLTDAPDSVQYDLYNGDNELAYTTTKLLADADSNRDITIVASLNSEDDVNHKFKIEFTNITFGQHIRFAATSISGLDFYENRVTDPKTDIIKVYKDADGNEFPVHIYAEPKVDHNYWRSNDLINVYQYNNNISSSDKIVIEFDTIINNINANGKTIHFEAPSDQPQDNFTLNVYSDDTLLYSDTRVFDMAVDVEINTDSQN